MSTCVSKNGFFSLSYKENKYILDRAERNFKNESFVFSCTNCFVVLLCNAVLFQHKSKHFCTPYLPLELNNQMQVFSFGCNSSNVGSKQLFRKETTFQKKSVSMCIFSLLFSWGEKGRKPNLCQFNVVKSICGSFLR